jgi:hypothetical protein
MASPGKEPTGDPPLSDADASQAVEGGSYDVLCSRLGDQGRELAARADSLNQRRKEVFGGIELTVIEG